MKKLLFFLWLLPGFAIAQTPLPQNVTQVLNYNVYRDNPFSSPSYLIPFEDSATYTAKAHFLGGTLFPSNLQPYVARSPGSFAVRWDSTSRLPDAGYVEIWRAGRIAYTAKLFAGKNPTSMTAPTSMTILSTAPVPTPPITIETVFNYLLSLLLR